MQDPATYGRDVRIAQRGLSPDTRLMSYDEVLAERVRDLLEGQPGVREQRMFGGLAFLIGGHMAAAASGSGGLLLRCPPDQTDELSEQPHVSPMVMRGREMSGWLRVEREAITSDDDLARWVSVGVEYARTLPAKA